VADYVRGRPLSDRASGGPLNTSERDADESIDAAGEAPVAADEVAPLELRGTEIGEELEASLGEEPGDRSLRYPEDERLPAIGEMPAERRRPVVGVVALDHLAEAVVEYDRAAGRMHAEPGEDGVHALRPEVPRHAGPDDNGAAGRTRSRPAGAS
jgi:hypothetical protein